MINKKPHIHELDIHGRIKYWNDYPEIRACLHDDIFTLLRADLVSITLIPGDPLYGYFEIKTYRFKSYLIHILLKSPIDTP